MGLSRRVVLIPAHARGRQCGPLVVLNDVGNGVAIVESFIPQILREPALVADEDGGVVVVPVSERVAAGPGGVGRFVRPLR